MKDSVDIKSLAERLSKLEQEFLLMRLIHPEKRVVISLRGIAKRNVSMEELDESIEDAKRSLFKLE